MTETPQTFVAADFSVPERLKTAEFRPRTMWPGGDWPFTAVAGPGRTPAAPDGPAAPAASH